MNYRNGFFSSRVKWSSYDWRHENRRYLLLTRNKNLARPPPHPCNPRPFYPDSLNRKEVPMMRTSTTDTTPCNHNT